MVRGSSGYWLISIVVSWSYSGEDNVEIYVLERTV